MLRCSDGLEVLELGLPGTHATLADHSHPLPTTSAPQGSSNAESNSDDGDAAGANVLPADYTFGGQRFVHQRFIETVGRPPSQIEDGIAWHETGVEAATARLACVRLGSSAAAAAVANRELDDDAMCGFGPPPEASVAPNVHMDNAHLRLVFVRSGTVTLETLDAANKMKRAQLERTDCATLAPSRPVRWFNPSKDLQLVEISFPMREEPLLEEQLLAALLLEQAELEGEQDAPPEHAPEDPPSGGAPSAPRPTPRTPKARSEKGVSDLFRPDRLGGGTTEGTNW